jgi:hypothetical protein
MRQSVIEPPSALETTADRSAPHPRWIDALGILWILAAAALALLPTYLHGTYFGSFDFLSHYGLTTASGSGAYVHNASIGDQSDEVLPWIQLAWVQVHHGHLPLWNSYEALGMPLAFNFGSGAFSFPALISYLTPLRVIYWVQNFVSLVVGGTGAYFFGRVLRLHPIACVFAGTTWVLSGPFFGYLGLPDTSVMSWAGWTFAAAVLIMRGSRRLWSLALFAVSIAFSFLAGNPQIEFLILLVLVFFIAVVLVMRTPRLGGSGPIRRPAFDLVVGFVGACALSAPLLLPGMKIANASVRSIATPIAPAPVSHLIGLVFQRFWGQPIAGSFLNGQGFYVEQWVYVGSLAVAFAVVAVIVRWRRPEVAGLAVATVVAVAASVSEPANHLLEHLPVIGHSWWGRSLISLAFLVTMLSAVGLDAVLRSVERRRATRSALGAFGVIALVLGLVWLFGRGSLPAYAEHIRAQSFVWPAISTAVGIAACGALLIFERRASGGGHTLVARRRLVVGGVAFVLLLCQTAFMVADNGNIFSSSSTPYKPTPAVMALQNAVGSSLVGLGVVPKTGNGLDLGLNPDTNIPFGIHEFAEYDPITPLAWFSGWQAQNGTFPGSTVYYIFIPGIKSATVARRYGISYVLEEHRSGLSGAVFDRRIGNEYLYRIPRAAAATLVRSSTTSRFPSTDAVGSPVRLDWTGPSGVQVVTHSSSATVLRLRLASFPGWRATIDGKPLSLSPYLSMMLEARIPPGTHRIELHYWPTDFSEGIALAALAVVAFAGVAVYSWRRKPGSPSNAEGELGPTVDGGAVVD